jgi:hypothetical protein
MRRTFLAGAALLAFASFAFSNASALASLADDHGKHQGKQKHDRDDHGRSGDDRHDKGKHKGWDNPHNPHYSNWDYDHDRIRPGHRYPHGRYEHVKQHYVVRAFDVRTRNIVLYDRSNWVVATYDVPHCRDWNWDRDDVYVYDDDDHAGWYLLFNARLGRSVHVEFSGVR